jgi:hypothetical protein
MARNCHKVGGNKNKRNKKKTDAIFEWNNNQKIKRSKTEL